jgi:hypothetical protein
MGFWNINGREKIEPPSFDGEGDMHRHSFRINCSSFP